RDAANDQPERGPEAPARERVLGIRGTGRRESARARQDRRDRETIGPHEEEQEEAEAESRAPETRRDGAGRHRGSRPTRRLISAETTDWEVSAHGVRAIQIRQRARSFS